MDIAALVNITSRAWTLPILARLHEGTQARQAPLLAATGAGRTAFAQSLQHLIDIDLIERNPGHGHPLRPEFRLTAQGIEAAALAHAVHQATTPAGLPLLRRTWVLPILSTLQAPRHFNDIGRHLGRITDRALSQSLRIMEDHQWVLRDVSTASRPPRPLYSPINTGLALSRIAAPRITLSP